MKNIIKVLLVILLVLVIARSFIESSNESSTADRFLSGNTSLYEDTKNDETQKEETQKEETERVIYSDENVIITYLGVDDPYTGLTTFFMRLKLENNFDRNVFVTVSDEYVNDTAVSFFGGNISFDGIKPGKKAVCNFGFGYNGMGITKVDEIYKVEFKIKLVNPDDFSEVLLETDVITINLD